MIVSFSPQLLSHFAVLVPFCEHVAFPSDSYFVKLCPVAGITSVSYISSSSIYLVFSPFSVHVGVLVMIHPSSSPAPNFWVFDSAYIHSDEPVFLYLRSRVTSVYVSFSTTDMIPWMVFPYASVHLPLTNGVFWLSLFAYVIFISPVTLYPSSVFFTLHPDMLTAEISYSFSTSASTFSGVIVTLPVCCDARLILNV